MTLNAIPICYKSVILKRFILTFQLMALVLIRLDV